VGALVRIARERHHLDNLEFRRARAERLPYEDGEFDLVICLNSLPELTEVRRVAAPGAELLRANTYFGVTDDQPHWDRRWREMGFERRDGANVGTGSWELYLRTD
jgi:ubiquinone/menaquinone biosynthesis C-methylase UbiE